MLLTASAAAAPSSDQTETGIAPAEMSGFQQRFLRSVAQGSGIFPTFWRPYQQKTLSHPLLMNSPRLLNLIHEGKLELSLADAMALTLGNNVDVVIQRYVVPIAQTDVLRAKSGQAARGFTGALYPSELNAGAIGAGVTNTGGAGGTGNAGGITGGGGAVLIGAAGAFDPVVNSTFSRDRVTSPLNSVVVSGIPTTTSYATALSESYAQMFREGTMVTDALPQPQESDLPRLSSALATAQANRPELRQAQNNLQNQDIAIRYTENNMKPSTALFGPLCEFRLAR
jgi:hypothetical protein